MTVHRGDTLRLSVDVTNNGAMDGKETVLWYVRDPVSSITRPIKELLHFEKRNIRKGTTETFVFNLVPEDNLSYVNDKGEKILESGDYYIMVKDKKIKITLDN